MSKYFRNFLYFLLSNVLILSPNVFASIQKRIQVTEFIQSDIYTEKEEFDQVDGIGNKRSNIIFYECLKTSLSNNRLNEILENGGKVIAYIGDWQNEVEYIIDKSSFRRDSQSSWETENAVCKGKEFILEVNKLVYQKIVKKNENIPIKKGPFKSIFKYANSDEIYNQKYFHFVKVNPKNEKLNILSYLDSNFKYHIFLNKNNTFTMTTPVKRKDDLVTVKGIWKRNANNYFHLDFDNGDYVILEKMEF